MNRKKVVQYIKKYIGLPILVYLVYSVIYAQYYTYKIDNCDYEIISCKVYEVVRVIKSPGFGISYKYKINNIEYDEYETEPNIYKDELKHFLIGRNLPLLICKSDSKYREILLAPEEFEERGLTYPDSMRFYMEYLK